MEYIKLTPITSGMLLGSTVAEPSSGELNYSSTTLYLLGDTVVSPTTHRKYRCANGKQQFVTMTIASPCVVSWEDHEFEDGTPVTFATGGALPTGLVPGAIYYIKDPTADSFNVSTTPGGAAIDTSGTQSGTHLARASNAYGQALTDPVYWADVGPSNRWAMFDGVVGTQTQATDLISVQLAPGLINSVVLMEVEATEAEITLTNGGVVEYSAVLDLDATVIIDYYDYFFTEYVQRTEAVVIDIPPFEAGIVTIDIRGTGTVKCGLCTLGVAHSLGDLQADDAAGGFIDYSVKETDDNGQTRIIEKPFARTIEGRGALDDFEYNRIHRLMTKQRAKPGVLVALPDNSLYDFMISYGICAEFKLLPQHPEHGYTVFRWEGLI